MATPPTHIHDTGIYDDQQRPANGTAIIQWADYTDVDGNLIHAGNITATVSNGTIDISLPAAAYAVEYFLATGRPATELWAVPVTPGNSVTISQCVAQSGTVQGIGGGPRGLRGYPGPQGAPSTIPGPVGQQGPEGQQGPAGPPGAASNVPGPVGPPGVAGPPGAASTVPGTVGPVGAPGSPGAPGAVGPAGQQGIPGIAGQPGPQGTPGQAGPAGAQGPAGPLTEETRPLRCQALEPTAGPQLAAAAGARATIFSSNGAGNIESLQLALISTAGNSYNSLQDCQIGITIDGQAEMLADIGTFLLIHAEPSTPYPATDTYTLYDYLPGQSFGAYRKLFIPYATSCRIDVINKSAAGAQIFSQVYYYVGVPPLYLTGTRRKSFHLTWTPLASVAQYANLTAANISGRGAMACIQAVYAQTPYAAKDTTGAAAPTFLEGNVSWQIDGAAPEQATGTEDFFGGQFYWNQSRNASGRWGCVKRGPFGTGGGSAGDSGPNFAVVAYRNFEVDPIVFNTSLVLTLRNGQSGQGSPGPTLIAALVAYYLDQ